MAKKKQQANFKKTMKVPATEKVRVISAEQDWMKNNPTTKYEQTTFDKTEPAKLEGIQVMPVPKIKDKIFAGEILEEDTTTPRLPMVVAENHKNRTVGRNKSGCLWKKGTSKKNSNSLVSMNRTSWDKRVEERLKKKSLQQRLNELREERAAAKRKSTQRYKDKLKRKEVNEMRSAKYQVIKNLAKTKKWTKKAKATLTKLPAEIFYEKFK